MKKKKVAIVSCFFVKNYGSELQAYATQKALDKLGIDNETIDCIALSDGLKRNKIKFYLKNITDLKTFYEKIKYVRSSIILKFKPELRKKIFQRDKKHIEFRKYFRLTKPISSFDELKLLLEDFTDVLVGSDQLWLPSNIVADYYTLNWVPDEYNKISYATSFGVRTLPKSVSNKTAYFLKRINHLSVREKSGVEIVRTVANRDAIQVCDPTLLLDSTEWMDIQKREPIVNGKYIYCYFLGDCVEHRNFVRQLSQRTGLKIVASVQVGKYKKCDENFADEVVFEAGPGDFINLIRNAEHVCTDSFHGTVFSIINRTDFYTFYRFSSTSAGSTNTRIESLFELVEFKGRMVTKCDDLDMYYFKDIPFDEMLQKIENNRKQSLRFLSDAILNGE